MNSDVDDPSGTPGFEQEEGQPIRVFARLQRETSPDFVAKVRRRIHRRTTASQIASFSWHLPKLVLIEMADILRDLAVALGGKKEPQP